MAKAWPVPGIAPDAPLAENARRILAVRTAELYALEPAARIESAVQEQHDLRIAAKRLRYTLELFRAVFGEAGEKMIEQAKAIQEELGVLHDHDVRIDLIEDELRRAGHEAMQQAIRDVAAAPADQHEALATSVLRPAPDDTRRGLLALLGREHVRRREQYRTFQALWERLGEEGMRAELVALSSLPLGRTVEMREEEP